MQDVIIIGGGHNGLACALYLAKAGWDVLVLERNREVAGALRSAAITRPGFIRDLYAINQNLFLRSPVYRDFKTDPRAAWAALRNLEQAVQQRLPRWEMPPGISRFRTHS